MRLFRPAQGPQWLVQVLQSIERAMAVRWDSPLMLQSFAKADLPTAANWTGGIIYVTDDVGGETIAFSDGADWLRVQDRAVIS